MTNMEKIFSIVVEKDEEGYFVASVPELPGCNTQAKTLDKLMERVKEAIDLCLEVKGEEAAKTKFVGVQLVSVKVPERKRA